jgi:hypothetical protein
LTGRRCLCAPGLLPRLGPPDESLSASLRIALVADLFALVTIFGNECSNLRHLAKRSKYNHCRLCLPTAAPRLGRLPNPAGLAFRLDEIRTSSGAGYRRTSPGWFEKPGRLGLVATEVGNQNPNATLQTPPRNLRLGRLRRDMRWSASAGISLEPRRPPAGLAEVISPKV